MYLEAVHAGDVAFGALGRYEGWVDLKHDVVKGSAKVGPIDGGVTGRLGVVYILAADAVELDGFLVGGIGLPHGQQWMGVTEDPRALAKVCFLVFVELQRRGGSAARPGGMVE